GADGRGAELPGRTGPADRHAPVRRGPEDGYRRAPLLPGGRPDDHRGRARLPRPGRRLCGAGRARADRGGRAGVERAGVVESVGAADLLRAGSDGAWRGAVADGPAAAAGGGTEEGGGMTPPTFRSSRRKPSPLGEGWTGTDASKPVRNHWRLAGQNGVPAFARMSGWSGWPLLLTACLLFLIALPALAQEPPPAPDRPLPDAAQEARAQALFDRIRCVVCQHEAIADSPAVIAADMRQLVREEIAAGRSDAEIRQDLVRRYGDF